jgi:hypothetical protein
MRVAARPVRLAQARRSKYGAVATVVDNIRFASQAEARRYGELKLLEKAGEICALQCQVRYPLFVGPHNAWIGSYVADFSYTIAGEPLVIEDVKGFKTPLYRWKKKHVEAQYGVTIREVRRR